MENEKQNDIFSNGTTHNIMNKINTTFEKMNDTNHTINSGINNNSMLKKIITKVKDELAKEEIKTEINGVFSTLYDDVYNKFFPYYLVLVLGALSFLRPNIEKWT